MHLILLPSAKRSFASEARCLDNPEQLVTIHSLFDVETVCRYVSQNNILFHALTCCSPRKNSIFWTNQKRCCQQKAKKHAGRCVTVRPLHTVPLIRLQVPQQRPCDCSGQTDAAPELGYLRPGFGLGFWR